MLNIHEKLQKFPLTCFRELQKKYPESELYLVGGAVRDFLLGRETVDLDFVVRNLEPNVLEKFLEKYGKVDFVGKSFGVYKFRPRESVERYEYDIALPRTEHSFNTGGYRDVEVTANQSLKIEDDLKRRDFTINAIALKLDFTKDKISAEIIDFFAGQDALKKGLIKTVGEPNERFQEDATRMMRAVRFAMQLNFKLDEKVSIYIKEKKDLIKKISTERIKTELDKIIISDNAEKGFRLLTELGLMEIIIPELFKAMGIDQSRNHIYDVYEHSLRSLGFAVSENFNAELRWSALLHDIGKPVTRAKEGDIYTFFNHERVGAKMTRKILTRLRFSEKEIEKISHYVLHHMFYYNIDEITDSAVRRLIRKVGPENIDDLIKLRIADRLGMGRPKGKPFKLIELERRIKEVSLDPLSVKMLKINGEDIMKTLKINPGPRIGLLLNAVLGEILEDPKKNTPEYLLNKVKELNEFDDKKLRTLTPDVAKHEEERREQIIGKPLVYKGKKLERSVRRIKNVISNR
jgi:putative nucleotidyltransferase with HDIG domain